MSKRFTDVKKWEQAWFRKLSPEEKLTFIFLCDRVDQSGCWEVDIETFRHYTQCRKPFAELVSNIKGISFLTESQGDGGILFLQDFVNFQYGELSERCPAHKPIFKVLAKNGLLGAYKNNEEPFKRNNENTLYNTLPNRVKEKEIDKEEDILKEQIHAIYDFWNAEIAPHISGGEVLQRLTDKRKTLIKSRLTEFKGSDSPLAELKNVLKKITTSAFLCGKVKNIAGAHQGWKADFEWAMKAGNFLKIKEGKYCNTVSQNALTDQDHEKGWG
jgi:hypothetical protein